MPKSPPDRLRSVEYLRYLAESHPGKYDKDIKASCEWAANEIELAESILQDVIDAIKAAKQDIMPCGHCGAIVITIPEVRCLCKACAKKAASAS